MESRGKWEAFVPTCRDTYAGSQLDISSVMLLSYQQLFSQSEGVEGVGVSLRKISRR
jgi:hypothetical protein